MIKITCIEDLKNIGDLRAKYIAEKELCQLFSLYQIDNISCFGTMFLIEDGAELEHYSAMELTEPINGNFEFTEKYIFKQCNREDIYIFGCIIVSYDFAVDILVNKKLLTAEQTERFTSTITNKEIEITDMEE